MTPEEARKGEEALEATRARLFEEVYTAARGFGSLSAAEISEELAKTVQALQMLDYVLTHKEKPSTFDGTMSWVG